MKNLLSLGIAITAIGFQAAIAQPSDSEAVGEKKGSVWLVLILRTNPVGRGASMVKIESRDLDQCNEQGALYLANQEIQPDFRQGRDFMCIEGK